MSMQKKDSRIRVFHKENGGVSSARNLGLDEAKGEWIAFVDSDDWVGKRYLEDFYQGTNGVDLVIVGYKQVVDDVIIYKSDYTDVLLNLESKYKLVTDYNVLNKGYPFNKLFRQELLTFNSIRFNENVKLAEDLFFFIDYLEFVHEVKMSSSSEYNYILRPGSLSGVIGDFFEESLWRDIYCQYISKLKVICNSSSLALLLIDRSLADSNIRLIRSIYTYYRNEDIRFKYLEYIDVLIYYKYHINNSYREYILSLLLKLRFFRLYDYLYKKII